MRFRWRHVRQFWINKIRAIFVVIIKACQTAKVSWRLTAFVSMCVVFVWWMKSGNDLLCDGQQVQDHICFEYSSHRVSGDICYDMCVDRLYRLSECQSVAREGTVKTYRVTKDGKYLANTEAVVDLSVPNLREGMPLEDFDAMLVATLATHLGQNTDMGTLVRKLGHDFDINKDDKLNYGEAQTLWKLLHQPQFLNYYLLQESAAVPHLNATCGPLTMWSHKPLWSHLYSKRSLWPLSIVYQKAFRMTLPSWPRRAKVIISLLELSEELLEIFGAGFHLCNISGESIFYNDKYDVLVSEQARLIAEQQIQVALSNRTCHHDHDCFYTHQCQTKCDALAQKCTHELTRPNVAKICDIIQDYLIFDAPKSILRRLARRVRQCRDLWWSSSPDFAVMRSVMIFDLKTVLWGYIQDIKL